MGNNIAHVQPKLVDRTRKWPVLIDSIVREGVVQNYLGQNLFMIYDMINSRKMLVTSVVMHLIHWNSDTSSFGRKM